MKKFPQIFVNFALRGVVGIRGKNIVAALAKSPLAARKVLTEASTGEAVTLMKTFAFKYKTKVSKIKKKY